MLYSAMNWPAVSSHATEQWSDSFGVLSTPLDCYSADHFKGEGGGKSKFFWYILFFGYLLNFILKILKIGTPETWVEQESEEHVKYLRTV